MRPQTPGHPQALSGALTPAERPEGPHRTPTTALASLAPATRRAYVRALERLEGWLAGRTLEDGALADYLAQLFDAGRSPAVAGQVVAAVRLRAKLAGTTSPAGPATARVLAGFRRRAATGARSRACVGTRRTSRPPSPIGARSRAFVTRPSSVASDAMLRVSESPRSASQISRSRRTAQAGSRSGTRRPTCPDRSPYVGAPTNDLHRGPWEDQHEC